MFLLKVERSPRVCQTNSRCRAGHVTHAPKSDAEPPRSPRAGNARRGVLYQPEIGPHHENASRCPHRLRWLELVQFLVQFLPAKAGTADGEMPAQTLSFPLRADMLSVLYLPLRRWGSVGAAGMLRNQLPLLAVAGRSESGIRRHRNGGDPADRGLSRGVSRYEPESRQAVGRLESVWRC